jgi:uncharacterized protein (TIGR03435 family)
MSRPISVRLTFAKKITLAVVAIATPAVPISVRLMNAPKVQAAPATTPKFEVASVKSISGGGGGRKSTGGLRFGSGTVTSAPDGVTVRQIILEAYHLTQSQVSGGPSWLDSDRFALQAKTETSDRSVVSLMLQTLLAERFKLMASRGTKEMPVYALTVGKRGPGPTLRKLNEGEDSPSPAGFQSGGATEFAGHAGGQGMVLKSITMQEFAYPLSGLSGAQEGSQLVGRPVLNKTNLQGQFYVRLMWSGDDDFMGAFQDELGLRLESQKAVMDVLVIDHLERPSEN